MRRVIARPALRDQVKDVLLERIVRGDYQPGERLVETAHRARARRQPGARCARRCATSSSSASSCTSRTAAAASGGSRPASCARPSRCALRSRRSPRAWRAEQITDADLARLDALLEEMVAAARSADPLAQAHANARFHATIVAAAGNATLERQWSLLEPFARTYLTSVQADADLEELAERHRPDRRRAAHARRRARRPRDARPSHPKQPRSSREEL